MKPTLILFLLLPLMIYSSFAQNTNKEKMFLTTNKILVAIKNGSEKEFIELIDVVINKDSEMLHNDFIKIENYYQTYLGNKEIKPILIDTPNFLGQKIVQILFHKGTPFDDIPFDIRLDLYFGPPSLFSLNKLTGYKIVETSEIIKVNNK